MSNTWQGGMRNSSRSLIGYTVLGVVLAVRYTDQALAHPFRNDTNAKTVECDVLAYGQGRRAILRNVAVLYPHAGQHDYLHQWIPKATTMDLSGADLNLSGTGGAVSDPKDMDGDHVVIAFLYNDPSQPYILGGFQHPAQARRPASVDGRALGNRWRGVTWGIDDKGNPFIDTSLATDGTQDSAGDETPLDNATGGNIPVTLAENATLTIAFQNSDTEVTVTKDEFRVKMGTGAEFVVTDGQIQLGDGATDFVPLANALKLELDALRAWALVHEHASIPPDTNPPSFSTAWISDDVKVKKTLT